MATALELNEENKPITLACVLCKDESKKPKLLPCQHSFCTQCLVQHQETLDEGKPFCCPSCHKDIELRDDAVESLPDNYVYDIVKEVFGGIKSSEIKCISCRQIEMVTSATHKCLDCGDTLCKQCNQYHCRTTLTKHHKVASLEDFKKGDFKGAFSKRKMLYCVIHSTEEQKIPISSFCDDCKRLVCATCIHSDHKGHEFTELHEAREEREDPISNNFKNLQKSEKDQQKRLGNINDCIANTKEIWNNQETEIYNKATEIYAMVEKIKDEKLAELKSHYEEELQRLNDLLDEAKCRQSSLQATVAFTREFLENSTDSDFLYHEKDVQSRVESSQKKENHYFQRSILRIEKQNVYKLSKVIKNVFGRMNPREKIMQHKCRIGETKKVFSRKVKMVAICGITFNYENKEIVLSGSSGHESLLVLNEDGTFKRYISCENAHRSFDIYIQEHYIFATIFLPNSRQILVIDEEETIRKSIKLPNDDQLTDYTLGVVVDEDKTVFVASDKTNRIYRMHEDDNTLSVFLANEKRSNIYHPSYLCMMSSGSLLVSSRGSSNIQLFSKEGQLLWKYDGKKEDNPLMNPCGVCCDEDGYIYVADSTNCRIQVLYDKQWIGNIPIDKKVKDHVFVPLFLTPEGELIYGYGDNLVKVSFWE